MMRLERTALTALLLLALGGLAIQAHPWGLGAWLLGWACLLRLRWPAHGRLSGQPSRPARPWAWGLGLLLTGSGAAWLWMRCGYLYELSSAFWLGLLPALGIALLGAALSAWAWPGPQATLPETAKAEPQGPWPWAWCAAAALGLRWLPWPLALPLACAPLALPARFVQAPPSTWRSHGSLCAAFLVVGLALRLWQPLEIPQGINYEEGVTLELANPVINGKTSSLFSNTAKFNGVIAFQHLAGSVYHWLDLRGVLPLRRAMTVGWAVLTVYAALLAATCFSWRAAVGTSAYLALAFFPLHYSRFGFYFIWAPAVAAATLAHALWALRSRHFAAHAVAGAAWAGLAGYGWIAGWTTPLLLALPWALGLGLHWERWKARLGGLAAAAACFASLSVLNLRANLQFPGGISTITSDASGSIFGAGIPPEVTLSSNLLLHLTEALRSGTSSGMHYLPDSPFVPPAVALLALAGLGLLLAQRLSLAGLSVLAALALALLPPWISNPLGRNLGRSIMLLLPLSLLFGLGWASLINSARRFLPGERWAGGAVASAVLAIALVPEPVLYFRDYRNDHKAITANGGPWYKVVQAVRGMRKGKEPVFFSSKFTNSVMLVSAFPSATIKPVRGASDLFGFCQRFPSGILVTGPLVLDWLPWLKDQGAPIVGQLIEHPLAADVRMEVDEVDKLQLGTRLAGVYRWEQSNEPQLQRLGDGSWSGYLWPARPGLYDVSVSKGSLHLPGGLSISNEKEQRVWLQSVPQAVRVTGAASLPVILISDSGIRSRNSWDRPVWPRLRLEGLRQTLKSSAAPQGRPWVSLMPSLSQTFAIWNYENDISPLPSFPFQGRWEGTLTVPKGGAYRFKLLNSFASRARIRLDGAVAFESDQGLELKCKEARLRPGASVPIVVEADEITPNSQMRLVYDDGAVLEAVPSSWLAPAPLPLPEAQP